MQDPVHGKSTAYTPPFHIHHTSFFGLLNSSSVLSAGMTMNRFFHAPSLRRIIKCPI
jgi:hypothetical protein